MPAATSPPSLPLQDNTLLVTRAAAQAGMSRQRFEQTGARVIDFPALEIGPPDDWGPLDGALARLEHFDWLVLSSANGVEAVRDRLALGGRTWQDLERRPRIAAVGHRTARCLEQLGWTVDFVPPEFVADSLIEHWPRPVSGLKMLLPRVQSGGRPLLARHFSAEGALVSEVPAYESRCPAAIPPDALRALEQGDVAAITYASGKTVVHSVKLLQAAVGERWLTLLQPLRVISIGPQTSRSCRQWLGRVDREANPHDLGGLVAATVEALHRDPGPG
ncbi:MAG: uroporphyrinogen-III synthase [Aphanocapsa feldmannii 288cV]|nr:MAG: uroporphyrinogen-III synthase [Aphanocapsa feldmannii 288cV]